MAVSRYIPKNIKKYKPKYFWGFTSRQIIALIVTAVLITISLKTLGDNISAEIRIYASSFPAVIPLLFGFIKVYDMPLERFIPEVYHDHFKNSPKRYRITAPSLRLTKQTPLKPDNKNRPLAVAKRQRPKKDNKGDTI